MKGMKIFKENGYEYTDEFNTDVVRAGVFKSDEELKQKIGISTEASGEVGADRAKMIAEWAWEKAQGILPQLQSETADRDFLTESVREERKKKFGF